MRVIAGEAGGISLSVPKTLTRPTQDRVREAIFSSLGDRVPNADVLDLYAGSGSIGIESLSRGARSVLFVDDRREACQSIEENLKKTQMANGTVRCSPVSVFLDRFPKSDAFDLIFADPPYARDEETAAELGALMNSEALAKALREEGWFILESLAGKDMPEHPLWQVDRERSYGDTQVSFFRKQPESSTEEGSVADQTGL